MNGVLVDSDVLIEVFRARNDEVVRGWRSLGSQPEVLMGTSAVIVAEMWRGVRPGEGQRLKQLLQELTCLPLERENGELAGSLMRRYTPSHGLELPDALIATVAILYGLNFWTRNRRHFPMPELQFYEP